LFFRQADSVKGMPKRDLIVVGASAGGVEALSRLCALLPADLPASLFIVQHIGNRQSRLAEILGAKSALQAIVPRHGEAPAQGCIYVAPSDHHMLLHEGRISLTRGPKENHTRPAIDPLFRSAALCCGPRVIGLVMSGYLDDGTAGLQAIKDCGGVAMAQDPAEAEFPDMPASALANVAIDFCAGAQALAGKLAELAGSTAGGGPNAPVELATEHLASIGEGNMADYLKEIGHPSTLVCPECGGALWEIGSSRPMRFRCHTGHAYTLGSLANSQELTAEETVWRAVRALQDSEILMQRTAADHARAGRGHDAEAAQARAQRYARMALRIEKLLEEG
jgi:two-component system chemotaxis response regulator CheB